MPMTQTMYTFRVFPFSVSLTGATVISPEPPSKMKSEASLRFVHLILLEEESAADANVSIDETIKTTLSMKAMILFMNTTPLNLLLSAYIMCNYLSSKHGSSAG